MLVHLKSNQTPAKLKKQFYKHIDQLWKGSKQRFSQCAYVDNIQAWTDGYIAAYLRHDYLNLLPSEDNYHLGVNNLITQFEKLCDKSVNLNPETMLAYFKVSDGVFISLAEGGFIGFMKETFTHFVALLDLPTLNTTIQLKYCSKDHSKFYYKKDNGNEYIMLGLKMGSKNDAKQSEYSFTISEDRAWALHPAIRIKECY